MVQEYYAYMSRLTQEADGKMRWEIEFEVVEVENLNFFLGKETARSMDMYGKHGDILRAYRDYGVKDERFRRRKVEYLGETGFEYVTVYVENLDYTRYQERNWYGLWLSDKADELTGTVYEAARYACGYTDDPEVKFYASLGVMPTPQAEHLKELYRPYIPEESRGQIGASDGIVNAIRSNTQIAKVRFRYVGAALNVKLFDGDNKGVAFFDLGARVSGNPRLSVQRPCAERSRRHLIKDLRGISADNQMTIFISHWHSDHCNILGQFMDKRKVFTGTAIAANTEWFVPEDDSPIFQAMQDAIPTQQFHVYSCGEEYEPQNVNGNENIQVGKINYKNNPYPHHQGLYVQVKIKSGRNILLVGDSTYEGLPENVRTKGWDVLQVCHHGGNYHLPPAKPSREDAKQYIPRALASASAVYSADGFHYGHPDLVSVEDHQDEGYTSEWEYQLQELASRGANALGFI